MSTPTAQVWNESLWDFSVAVYGCKEIESKLLDLQNKFQANVSIMLWCCWLDEQKIFLSREALDDVLITVDTVNQATLGRLREVRRFIKEAGSFTEVQMKLISKQVLNAELMIEKVLIYRLQDLTRRFSEVMQDRVNPLTLDYYLEFLMIPDARQVAHLVQATCRRIRALAGQPH